MAEAADTYSDLDLSDEEPDSLNSRFSNATNRIKSFVSKLENEKLLRFYAFYKQATEGPCNTTRPRWFDMQGKMKWDAWNSLGDMSSEVAKQNYVTLMTEIDETFGKEEKKGHRESSWAAVSTLAELEEDIGSADRTIHDYCRSGQFDMVASLLKDNPGLALDPDDDGMFPIHWAADRGHNDIVALILSTCGLSVTDQRDASGQTALHYASSCGYSDIVTSLLKAGASRSAYDSDGNTPLEVATEGEIRALLKES